MWLWDLDKGVSRSVKALLVLSSVHFVLFCLNSGMFPVPTVLSLDP